MIKAICIDDEQLALDYLERLIHKLNGIKVIGKYVDPLEGLQKVLETNVDLVFLDIHLPELNGIQLAEEILKEKPDINIVFVTAYDIYAVEAFEINAIDYLVKPIKLERLKVTVDRVLRRLKEEIVVDRRNVLRMKISEYLSFEMEEGIFKPIAWRTAKAQELFLYLLQNHGTLVEKGTLMELLWKDKNVEKGYNLLYTTIYNVRKALSSYTDNFIIHNTSDGYLLELKDVSIDLFDWINKITILPMISHASINEYEQLLNEYPGSYLKQHDYVWIEAERQRIAKIWYHTARKVANYFEELKELELAIKWYNNICERYPEDEEAHFALMKIYSREDNFDLVLKQYRKLIRTLSEELATEPSSYIKKWYEKQINQKLGNKNIHFPS